MFIDTHAHMNLMIRDTENLPLSLDQIEQVKEIVSQAETANVKAIINVGTTPEDSIDGIKLAKKYQNVFAVAGLHPCNSFSNWKKKVEKIENLLENKVQNKIVGIGEIGFDFYHEPFDKASQNASFRRQIELAIEHDIAIVIHVRNAAEELLTVMKEYSKNNLKGVIHCFSQNQKLADQVLEWGFYIGIDGHITYPKNHDLRNIIKNTPITRLLLETDSPFLPPQQFRGKQNHPAYIPIIAQFIADLKETSLETIEKNTTENAKKLFGLTIT